MMDQDVADIKSKVYETGEEKECISHDKEEFGERFLLEEEGSAIMGTSHSIEEGITKH